MSNPNNQEKSSKYIIYDEIVNPENFSFQDDCEFLRAAGLDPDKIRQEGETIFRKKMTQLKSTLVKKENQNLLEKAHQYLSNNAKNLKETARETLLQLLHKRNPDLKYNFSKVESISNEDLLDMLDEIELMNFLDKMQDNDSEK